MNTLAPIPCSHWRQGDSSLYGRCTRGNFGGLPTRGMCIRQCANYDGPLRGAGDLVKLGLSAVGIPSCKGCDKRQVIVNSIIPFGGVKT